MKKQPKNKKSKSVWKRFRDSPWYVKVGIITTLLLVSFFVFKTCLNTYNVSVLDKAEVKMRQLDTPKANDTSYERSCSFPNDKFGSFSLVPGIPTCRVMRTDIFFGMTLGQVLEVSKEYLSKIDAQYDGVQTDFSSNAEFLEKLKSYSDGPSVDDIALGPGLSCYISFGVMRARGEDYSVKEWRMTDGLSDLQVITDCPKKVLLQIYPER